MAVTNIFADIRQKKNYIKQFFFQPFVYNFVKLLDMDKPLNSNNLFR